MGSRDSLFETVFPGLLDRLRRLGGQELAPTLHDPPTARYGRAGELTTAQMAVRRVIPSASGRTLVVQIAVRAKLIAGAWVPQMVSYHCGPDPAAMDEVYFRIDSSTYEGFHCHIRGEGPKPEKGGHISPRRVEPSPTLDPFDFMRLVEGFIATNVVPLKVARP